MRFVLAMLVAVLAPLGALAQTSATDFKGKQVFMVIGFPPGGGTDLSGRMLAEFLSKYLPGQPDVLVRNIPGADGLTATNHFVQQVKPDGLTILMASASTSDPIHYRKPEAKYDPSKFVIIGGVGRGGSVMVIRNEAADRLGDKSKPPAIMGTPAGVPKSGNLMTTWGIEYLGWNAKWVTGYKGTKDLGIAIERGEIDMVSTSNMSEVEHMTRTGKARMLTQTGTIQNGKYVPRSDAPKVPVLGNMMQGKIVDPIAGKAFAYYQALTAMDKWLVLPPGTPADIAEVYRTAFAQASADPHFFERGKKISEDFEARSTADIELLVRTLWETPDAALGHVNTLLKKQGIGIN